MNATEVYAEAVSYGGGHVADPGSYSKELQGLCGDLMSPTGEKSYYAECSSHAAVSRAVSSPSSWSSEKGKSLTPISQRRSVAPVLEKAALDAALPTDGGLKLPSSRDRSLSLGNSTSSQQTSARNEKGYPLTTSSEKLNIAATSGKNFLFASPVQAVSQKLLTQVLAGVLG